MHLMKTAVVTILLITLNGCTVFGMIADGAVENKAQNQRPVKEQDSHTPHSTIFSGIGLKTDIAIVQKIKDVLTPEQNKPKVRCATENGLRICYEEGALGY